ncbi:C40 family peptidase [Paenibacillus doosanensis]|uniref:Murein DD-endopeptidase MepS/Murein LD-carboxypeptidase n=1 Tax=Paenibacillus konkukensis TaxID=2020716 RepID=A0ABY4RHD5_9BACL|nr:MULTISPECIES: C40 family peptidase [Paenibacillus]MCS7459735.1 C40 family peptidase [Paenibacillus doosanensis]UQZ81849.1 Murein DD-endopeptidase MepS/Murein LD-carboxypeptidase precursor [Paenibacillus konkukensis]
MTKASWLTRTIVGASCLTLVLTSAMITAPISAHAATAEVQSTATASQKADKIIAKAKSLQGKVRYEFGVNNPSKMIFDCSSFTKYVFGTQGVTLKWGSTAQSKQGTYVSKSNLKKGDLIFFSTTTPGKVNHVGIYIGNGQFIHNTIGSSVNGVIISDLSKYSSRYITARRVL